MADLINNVQDGILQETAHMTQKNAPTNSLGKDAFLKLLSTQMRYQDPLNPNTDTQFVAQLATFSQLEQMQNLNSTSTNTQAFSLVGKNVIMKQTDSAGSTSYVSGKVNFASMTNGNAYLSINGNLYPASQLDTVIDDAFLDSLGLPDVMPTDLSYDKADPQDQSFKIYLGNYKNTANKVAIKINDEDVDPKNITISEGSLIIHKEALKNLEIGVSKIQVVFDDVSKTTISDKIKITVKDSTLEA